MQIRAITNQKGGVGKTTTSVNLGASLAEAGQKVLLIDLDPQGNLSTHVGLDIYNLELTLYDVLTQDRPLIDILQPTGHANLYCAPSNIDLSSAEIEMVSAVGRETILKEAIEALARDPESPLAFDTVLIDCPPSLGLLCINALVAADELLIPMQAEFFALQGMSKLMETFELVKKRLNAGLSIGGIVVCRMDTRTRLSAEVLDDIAGHFPELLFKTRIRQNVKLAEAPSFGQTVIQYAPDSNGAEDYRNLAAEVLGLAQPSEVIELNEAQERSRNQDTSRDDANHDDHPDKNEDEDQAQPDATSKPSIAVSQDQTKRLEADEMDALQSDEEFAESPDESLETSAPESADKDRGSSSAESA